MTPTNDQASVGADGEMECWPAVRTVERANWQAGELTPNSDQVAEEIAIALVYNGISHAVMIATPCHLRDFALGFSLTEGILASDEELLDYEVVRAPRGLEVRLTILEQAFQKLKHRRRNLAGRTGCGICGAESLEYAIQAPPVLSRGHTISHQAIDRAVSKLPAAQLLQQKTGGVHAAALCSPAGDIRLVREDVGRHNALDKLIGAIVAQNRQMDGFILMSSRASYEIVVKTAMVNIPLLVTVSAPTGLAIDLAEKCGMTLVGFTSAGRHAVYSGHVI
jgi:FdhD protein